MPAFERLIGNLATELAPVQAVENQAQQSTKGVTKEKNNTQAELKIGVGRLANVMIGYASEAKNVVLESDLTVLRTKFTKATQAEFSACCTNIVKEAYKLETHWADFGITKEGLADIEAKIALYDIQLPKGKEIKKETQKPVMKQTARVAHTDLTAKSNSKGELRFKFSDGGYYTIEVPLPNGEIRIFKDVEVKRGKTTTVEVLI